VVIAADQDVAYKSVVEVMDLLQSNGVRKVGLLTRPRSG
jgi:biopolymer transport protein ExbD